jgi:hypothetical protein
MTLKEKFIKVMNYQFYFGTSESEQIENASENLEKVSDKYAIEFLKWVVSPETSDLIHDLEIVGEIDENITPEQLLEIYKKEKGL